MPPRGNCQAAATYRVTSGTRVRRKPVRERGTFRIPLSDRPPQGLLAHDERQCEWVSGPLPASGPVSPVQGRLELQVKANQDRDSTLISHEGAELKVRLSESQGSGERSLRRYRVRNFRQPGGDARRLIASEGLPMEPPVALVALRLPADHVPAESIARLPGHRKP